MKRDEAFSRFAEFLTGYCGVSFYLIDLSIVIITMTLLCSEQLFGTSLGTI